MAGMKMSELREKDQDSLVNLEKELTENLFAARLQKRSGQLENTAKIVGTKRDLARVKTVLRARELGLEVIETNATPGQKPAEKKQAAKPAAKPAAKKEEKKKAKPEAKKAAAKSEKKSEKKAEKKADKKAGKSAGKKK